MVEIKIEAKNNEDKEKQFDRKEIVIEKKDETLEKLYRDKELQIIHKPPKISSKTLLTSIVISLIFGFIIGFLVAILFLKGKLSVFLKF